MEMKLGRRIRELREQMDLSQAQLAGYAEVSQGYLCQLERDQVLLRWLHGEMENRPIAIKATCAPHFYRIAKQAERESSTGERAGRLDTTTRGCLGGIAFCFISHVGDVYPCGYLELNCGNVRERSTKHICTNAEPFVTLRDFNNYRGKCGTCKYVRVCGGCRARAYAVTGDYLNDEPLCPYSG